MRAIQLVVPYGSENTSIPCGGSALASLPRLSLGPAPRPPGPTPTQMPSICPVPPLFASSAEHLLRRLKLGLSK